MPSVTNLPGYLSLDPSQRIASDVPSQSKFGDTRLHHRREQCHSNPQLNICSSSAVALSLPMSLQQRHSTGSLAVSEKAPRKGILKRPHTFNMGRERPSSLFPRAVDNSLSAAERHHQQQRKPLCDDNGEKWERRRKTAEEEDKVTTQRVEFAEKNAVAIFGDTTSDTEAGTADGSTKIRKTRKNAMAIVTPVVRDQQRPNDSIGTNGVDGRNGRGQSEEGNKSDEVSHIVGKWWFGRSTKFVVHCDRRGCSSAGGHSSREGTPNAAGTGHEHSQKQQTSAAEEQPYLTPTQRKQREINTLKKELRRSQLLCRDKERHLGQLKERLDEIERLMASSSSTQLVQCARLEQKLVERENEFIEEKEALIERHEHRIRQMNQEMTDLRTEIARKEKAIEEITNSRNERRDRAVQANLNASDCEPSDQRRESNSFGAPLSPSLVPATALGWVPPDSEKAIEYSENVPFGGEERQTDEQTVQKPTQKMLFGAPKPASPARGPLGVFQQPPNQIESQLLTTLDAYRSETVVWRTRTAQLELILQDLLLREGANARGATTAQFAPQKATMEMNGTTETVTMAGEGEEGQKKDVDGGSSESLNRQQKHLKQSANITEMQQSGECQRKECVEGRNRWEEEKQRMKEKLFFSEKEMAQMDAVKRERSADLDKVNTQLNTLRTEHGRLVQLAENRLCEIKAIQMTLNGAQAERDKLEQALAYIERRCHVMEQIGLDQGIVLVELDEFRQAPGDVFTFRGSKGTQTMLTAKALGYSERELDELQIQIRSMQMAFAEDKASMSDQLKDIEQMLTMKTELVTTLTAQLENAAKSAQMEDESHQRERDAFSERVAQLGRTAERVPILESELELARGEKSMCELKLKRMEEETDERMEKILAEAMGKSTQNEEYWTEKCGELERKCTMLASQLEHEKKVAEDERMSWRFSRLELDRRLHSAIEHAFILNARLNCPRRDALCDVRPRTANKYVICRPNQHDKGVGTDMDGAELESMGQKLRTLETEREWLRAEMDKMEREMAGRIEEKSHRQQQRHHQQKKKKVENGLPELTVTFHRGSDNVRLGGHRFDTDNDLERGEEEEDRTQISVFSLPAVLDHSDASFRSIGHAQIQQENSTTENDVVSSHRELSLQLPMPSIENEAKHEERSHSEPRRHGTEPMAITQINAIEESESAKMSQQHYHDELTRGQFEALRERIHELLSAIMSRGSTASESETTAQREAKLDQLFEQLAWWLRTIADGEQCQVEIRRRAEAMQRERDQLREQLRNALSELEVYRTEPRRTAWEQWTLKMGRSSSAEQLTHGGRPPLSERQLRRWKEIAGITFREVNQLRKQLTSAETDRLSLRNRLAILRGELAMEKCQRTKSQTKEYSSRRRRGSVDRLTTFNAYGETLASYNRWLGGDRWQSVPELDDEGMDEQQKRQQRNVRKEGKRGGDNVQQDKGTTIVQEALKRQLANMRQRIEQTERRREDEVDAKSVELVKVRAECELLKRENMMYEQKCDDMDRERQQMYLIMFRKGQQAANMEQTNGEEMDNATELHVVLRFLHDAFFYYLLNKGNAMEHMQAIMTMLNFTAEQKEQVYYKRRGKSH